MGGSGPTPQELMEEMAFESMEEFVDWLTSLDLEAMTAWLEMMLGD
jgi:hypothetical protein